MSLLLMGATGMDRNIQFYWLNGRNIPAFENLSSLRYSIMQIILGYKDDSDVGDIVMFVTFYGEESDIGECGKTSHL